MNLDEVKAKLAELSDLINALEVPAPDTHPAIEDDIEEIDLVTKSGVTKKFVLPTDPNATPAA